MHVPQDSYTANSIYKDEPAHPSSLKSTVARSVGANGVRPQAVLNFRRTAVIVDGVVVQDVACAEVIARWMISEPQMNADVWPTLGQLHDGCRETHAMRLYGGVMYFWKDAGAGHGL